MKSTGLYNIFVLVCFTVLAILFNKWWIIFFAILFFSSEKTLIYSRHRVCDKCGAKSPSALTVDEAIDKAKQAGWVHIDEGDLDYCPKCKDNLKLNMKE